LFAKALLRFIKEFSTLGLSLISNSSNILILFSSSWLNSIFSILPFIKTILLCSNSFTKIEGSILFVYE
jgi:hypothetical protein